MMAARIIDLGWLKGIPLSDARGAGARGINNKGTIVGFCGKSAFYWMEKKGMSLLEKEGYAYAINSRGDVTGKAGTIACIWKREGTRLLLPPVPDTRSAFGYAIADDGTVAGMAHKGVSIVSFRFSDGTLEELPDPPRHSGVGTYDQPLGCSAMGEIVGAMQGSVNGVGFYLKPGTSKREIISLSGKPVSATCIGGTKVYCGVGTVNTPAPPAVYDTLTRELQILDWPEGTYPLAANAAGWVVGQVETPGVRYAFVYSPRRGFQDLNVLLASIKGKWRFHQVAGINDSNELVGTGTINDKTNRAFLIRGL